VTVRILVAAALLAAPGAALAQTPARDTIVVDPAPAATGSAAGAPREVRPGMTLAQVRAVWGEPLAVRTIGEHSYAFFANDCARACGMNDVVILERDQVVDAVVRDSRRRYAGVSSSPAGRTPSATDVDTTATSAPDPR
jgi:hypothetical protein